MQNKTISLKELSKKLKEYKEQRSFTDKLQVYLKPANYISVLPAAKIILSKETREQATEEALAAIHYAEDDKFETNPLIKTKDMQSLLDKWINVAPNSTLQTVLDQIVENLEDIRTTHDRPKGDKPRASIKKHPSQHPRRNGPPR